MTIKKPKKLAPVESIASAGLAPRFYLGQLKMKLYRMFPEKVREGTPKDLAAWVALNPYNYWRTVLECPWLGSTMMLDELLSLKGSNDSNLP